MGHRIDHLPPSSAKVEERAELYFLLSLWAFLTICYKYIFELFHTSPT